MKLYTRKKGKENVAEQSRQRETFEQSFLNLDVLSLKIKKISHVPVTLKHVVGGAREVVGWFFSLDFYFLNL